MKTNHDILRERILTKAGIINRPKNLDITKLAKTEWSNKFEKYMRNRLIMGAFRYGSIAEPNRPIYDRVQYIRLKLDRYEKTGNLEALVDVANLSMMEFVEGHHPKKHFHSMDSVSEHMKEK